MASFPIIQPPDTTEISTYIKWWLGNISVDVISDTDLADLITRNITLYTDNLCKITYYSTVDLLNWLIRRDDTDSGSTGVSGVITKQREKEGGVEYETSYQESSSSTSSGWNKLLTGLLDDPTSMGCDPFEGEDKLLLGTVIIGGADINGYEESFRTRQRFGNAIKNNRFSFPRLY